MALMVRVVTQKCSVFPSVLCHRWLGDYGIPKGSVLEQIQAGAAVNPNSPEHRPARCDD